MPKQMGNSDRGPQELDQARRNLGQEMTPDEHPKRGPLAAGEQRGEDDPDESRRADDENDESVLEPEAFQDRWAALDDDEEPPGRA